MKRFWKFENIHNELWEDWKWQLGNRLTNSSNIREFFPNISADDESAFLEYTEKYHMAITPYTLSLIELDEEGNPLKNDPVWNQFRFYKSAETAGNTDYDGTSENWEAEEELPTRILQHKYPDRAIIRIVNTCFSHCNYCYLTSRILNKETSVSRAGDGKVWEDSLAYLRDNPQIRDVLVSGGEPLILDNNRIGKILADLAAIPSIKSVRLNTRVFTFNPYRFDRELVEIFKMYRLTALEIHVAHPREINEVFDRHLSLFDEVGYRPLILWRAPLLHTINDSADTLEELFVKLYQRRITPYYLFHYAPFTLGRSSYGLSVRKGCEIMKELRRRVPGPAFPRYTLFHIEGKQDIPLEPEGTPEFKYSHDSGGNPVIQFINWKNKWVEYLDIDD